MTRWLCWEAAANKSQPSNSLILGKIQGISLKTPPPLARNPLNSEFVWTNSLHIEQRIFFSKQRSLLRELRKFYGETGDVAQAALSGRTQLTWQKSAFTQS